MRMTFLRVSFGLVSSAQVWSHESGDGRGKLYHYEELDIALLVLEEVRPGTTQ
jgi:hypothetical protein